MFEKVKKIMSEEKVKSLTHLSAQSQKIKNERDLTAKKIISGEDKRMMLIIGPCSADSQDAVCDYVARLAKVARSEERRVGKECM